MKVAIAGATGFVGSRLVEKLQAAGHQVVVLSRDAAKAGRVFPASAYPNLEVVAYTPAESGDWQKSIAGCDAVVNLAGVPIAEERWTEARQQAILDSRRLTTAKLVEAIVNANPRPSVLVSASAIGYYGTSETAEFDETSPAGNDFFSSSLQRLGSSGPTCKKCGNAVSNFAAGDSFGNGRRVGKNAATF